MSRNAANTSTATLKLAGVDEPRSVVNRAEKSVISPFQVVVDSREQQPYTFEGLRANADQDHAVIKVPIVRSALPVGDYSIFGLASMITVERKSKADLYSSISQKRDNFEQRLRKMCLDHNVAAVVVEAEWSELLLNPPKHTQFNPKSLARSIFAWMIRWPRVHWIMMPNREMAEVAVYRFLERFWWAYQEGKWFEAETYREQLKSGNEDMGFGVRGGTAASTSASMIEGSSAAMDLGIDVTVGLR